MTMTIGVSYISGFFAYRIFPAHSPSIELDSYVQAQLDRIEIRQSNIAIENSPTHDLQLDDLNAVILYKTCL